MKRIKAHLENLIYSYDANEFFPVWYEGKLNNKAEFIAYKATRAFIRFSDAFDRLERAAR